MVEKPVSVSTSHTNQICSGIGPDVLGRTLSLSGRMSRGFSEASLRPMVGGERDC